VSHLDALTICYQSENMLDVIVRHSREPCQGIHPGSREAPRKSLALSPTRP
jgi:hypothetical protein